MSELQYRLVDVSETTGEYCRASEWVDFDPAKAIEVDRWEFMEFRPLAAEPKAPQRQYRWKPAGSDNWTVWLDVHADGTAMFSAASVATVEFRDKPEPLKWEVGKRYRRKNDPQDIPETVTAVDEYGYALITYISQYHHGARRHDFYHPEHREDFIEVEGGE